MPEMSTIKQFVVALQTGQTNTTRVLSSMFVRPGHYTSEPYWADLQQPYVLNTLPDWARALLKQNGLKNGELDHIDEWPNEEKEAVRQALVTAIQNNRSIVFSWELFEGNVSTNAVDNLQGTGDISITFRSPVANVRSSSVTYGDISVLIR